MYQGIHAHSEHFWLAARCSKLFTFYITDGFTFTLARQSPATLPVPYRYSTGTGRYDNNPKHIHVIQTVKVWVKLNHHARKKLNTTNYLKEGLDSYDGANLHFKINEMNKKNRRMMTSVSCKVCVNA